MQPVPPANTRDEITRGAAEWVFVHTEIARLRDLIDQLRRPPVTKHIEKPSAAPATFRISPIASHFDAAALFARAAVASSDPALAEITNEQLAAYRKERGK